jgi:hypothetical protein
MLLQKHMVLARDTSGACGYITENNGVDGAVLAASYKDVCVRLLLPQRRHRTSDRYDGTIATRNESASRTPITRLKKDSKKSRKNSFWTRCAQECMGRFVR